MEQINLLNNRKKTATKLAKNSKIFKAIIKAIEDKKGEDIVCLDLRKIHEAVADFFIVCTATSNPQCKAIADNIDDEVLQTCGERPYKQEGYQSQQWILIDYVNIVVHVMQPSARNFYKLEDMWSDAEISKVEE
ncbi:MAG: ribosome silencing factor [Bacteroidetes bacterium]|nr:ribosome silencing factor [Bacteroidota bacterium]